VLLEDDSKIPFLDEELSLLFQLVKDRENLIALQY
jgi:hypothetical protein